MNHRLRRKSRMARVETGRTMYGLSYARIVEGTVVLKTVNGVTKKHAARRAERLMNAKYPFV